MPILQIEALPPSLDVDVPKLLADVCVTVAEAAGLQPREVWATFHTLPPGHYVEGDVPAYAQPETTHPPLVTLIVHESRGAEQVEAMATAAQGALGRGLGLPPDNVFVSVRRRR